LTEQLTAGERVRHLFTTLDAVHHHDGAGIDAAIAIPVVLERQRRDRLARADRGARCAVSSRRPRCVSREADLVDHSGDGDPDVLLGLDLVRSDQEAPLARHEERHESREHESDTRHRNQQFGKCETALSRRALPATPGGGAHRFVIRVETSTRRSLPALPPDGFTGKYKTDTSRTLVVEPFDVTETV